MKKNKEQPLSIEKLEAQAIHLSSVINKQKRVMEWENPVIETLRERKRQLDDAFVFTPENIEKFLSLNKQIMEYQEKLLEEGRKLVRELEKRIAGNDNFLHDYEIEVVITPRILVQGEDGEWEEPDKGIYELLQSDINPVEISFDPRDPDSEWLHFDKTKISFSNGSNWNRWFAFNEHYICYGMHKLYDDSLYSYSDILKINDLWADIKMELQHYGNAIDRIASATTYYKPRKGIETRKLVKFQSGGKIIAVLETVFLEISAKYPNRREDEKQRKAFKKEILANVYREEDRKTEEF